MFYFKNSKKNTTFVGSFFEVIIMYKLNKLCLQKNILKTYGIW